MDAALEVDAAEADTLAAPLGERFVYILHMCRCAGVATLEYI